MRYMVLTLLSFWLLAGCSSEPTTQETSIGPMAAKMIEEPAKASVSQGISPVIEYVWHRAGENSSREALMENIAFWNAMIDAGEYDTSRANILFPRQETDDYDFVWALLWPSVEARDARWAYWNINDAPKWAAAATGILSYDEDNTYLFELSR